MTTDDPRMEGYALELAMVSDDPAGALRATLERCEARDPDLIREVIGHAVIQARIMRGSAATHPDSSGAADATRTAAAWLEVFRSRPDWLAAARDENTRISQAIAARRAAREGAPS